MEQILLTCGTPTHKAAIGLNGTGTDHYEEALKQLMQIVNTDSLFLFYATQKVLYTGHLKCLIGMYRTLVL